MTDLPVRFEELIEHHHDELYSYVWRLMDSAFRAEGAIETADVVQDVFIRAYGAFERLRPDSNTRAWLYKIATNCTYTMLRRRETLPLDEDSPLTDGRPSPDQEVVYRELLAEMHSALDDLPPAQRAAVMMRYLHGFEYAEIALALACSEESARANVSHGLRRLRLMLTEVGAGL